MRLLKVFFEKIFGRTEAKFCVMKIGEFLFLFKIKYRKRRIKSVQHIAGKSLYCNLAVYPEISFKRFQLKISSKEYGALFIISLKNDENLTLDLPGIWDNHRCKIFEIFEKRAVAEIFYETL